MKIFSWNVNGIRSVIKKNFIEFINDSKPDILCLQETRITMDDAQKLDIPFKYKYFYPAEKAGYSGVSIFSNSEPKSVEKVNLLKNSADEGRLISAEFDGFTLNSIYAPNSQDELKRFSVRHEWNLGLAKYLRAQKNCIVCGDFNVAHEEIDLARPDSNHESAGFSDGEREDFTALLADVPLLDIWRERNPNGIKYSWWSFRSNAREKNIGWRIDYFLVSPSLAKRIKSADVCSNIKGSDHAPVSIEI